MRCGEPFCHKVLHNTPQPLGPLTTTKVHSTTHPPVDLPFFTSAPLPSRSVRQAPKDAAMRSTASQSPDVCMFRPGGSLGGVFRPGGLATP